MGLDEGDGVGGEVAAVEADVFRLLDDPVPVESKSDHWLFGRGEGEDSRVEKVADAAADFENDF